MKHSFRNRLQAGEMLAERLVGFAHEHDVVVLGLPRGGVPVAYSIAERLEVPLDILLVRKLGIPGNAELAMGAVASDGVCVLRPEIIASLDISADAIEAAAKREMHEIRRREKLYRPQDSQPIDLHGRRVILVDDGLATGATMLAAVRAVRHESPARIIIAVPVAPAESIAELRAETDAIICLHTPEWFGAVSQFYDDFPQLEDAEVKHYLMQAASWHFQQGIPSGKKRDDTHSAVNHRHG